MTADTDQQPTSEGEIPAAPENSAISPAKKRKVAVRRSKLPTVSEPAGDEAPAEAAEKKPRAVRSRRKPAITEAMPEGEAMAAAPAGSKLISTPGPDFGGAEKPAAADAPAKDLAAVPVESMATAPETGEAQPAISLSGTERETPARAGTDLSAQSEPAAAPAPVSVIAADSTAPAVESREAIPGSLDAPASGTVNNPPTPEEPRRFDNDRQPFQGRRGDHRHHHRGDFQHRGDQPRGGNDFQGNRGGGNQQQGGFRQQQQGGGSQGQPNYQGGGGGADLGVSRPTEIQYGEGIIEVSGKGFGFLREAKRNFVQTPADIFVTPEVCRKYNLRDGQWIKGEIRRSSRGPQLFRLTALNGEDPEKFRNLPNFDELTSINPKKRIKLETVPDRYTTRVMDLMTPIGKGQRGLIVAPPRTGKTTLLQHIAEAVVKNHPDMKLIILLVDERPEEVTEIRRSVPQADVMASSNDSDLKSHTRIAQLAIERAKRLVEAGQDVFILLDSITRMARAFNNAMGGGRGTQSGGLAVGALEIPRKIFAAARNTEEAGSLTIMATALIETNSKMDDAIFQEFKGTGNMELVLDRKISDQRIYPAVDIFLSGTRREELLLQGWELDKINVIRRGLAGHKPIEAIERLLSFLKKFPTNTQMLASLPG